MGNINFIIRWLFNRTNKNAITSNSLKLNLDKIRPKIRCIFLTVMVLSCYNNVPKTSIDSSRNFSITLHLLKDLMCFKCCLSQKNPSAFFSRSFCVIEAIPMSSTLCRTHEKGPNICILKKISLPGLVMIPADCTWTINFR